MDFNPYYKGFNALENFATHLSDEISELRKIQMPYFIRLDRDEKDKYQDIFDIHQVEIGSLIQEIEKQKTHFDKIIDHMTVTTSKSHRCTKRGLIMGFLAFLFGGNNHSGTINQIKENLEILEQNQGLLADEMINQLRLINNQNV